MVAENLIEMINRNYDIGTIIGVKQTHKMNEHTFFVDTASTKYVLKTNVRPDFALIQDKVSAFLTERGFCQSFILRNKYNRLISEDLFIIYSFVDGNIYDWLSDVQFLNALKYVKTLNECIKDIPFNPSEIVDLNNWDKAKSVNFLINEFEYSHLPISKSDIALLDRGICILRENKDLISNTPKQLIHSDLGADNFIFDGDEVRSIIDFTPEYENELYSLCQFLLWNYYWVGRGDDDRVKHYLDIYYRDDAAGYDFDLYKIYILKTILFRIAGPLLENNYNIGKRFEFLNKFIKFFNQRTMF